MSDLQDSLNALKDPAPAKEKAPAAPAEGEFQQYSSSRLSTCLLTAQGTRINFTNYEYYTKDPAVIDYLDAEIAAGLSDITKGKRVSKDELNPAAALKRKIIEEFKASQAGRDFSAGPSEYAVEAAPKGGAGTGSMGTDGVAN